MSKLDHFFIRRTFLFKGIDYKALEVKDDFIVSVHNYPAKLQPLTCEKSLPAQQYLYSVLNGGGFIMAKGLCSWLVG